MFNFLTRLFDWIKRKLYLFIGIVIFIMGLLTFPLPIPLGLPLLVVGSVLLLTHSIWAKRAYIRLRQFAQKHAHLLADFLKRFEQLLRQKKHQLQVQLRLRRLKHQAKLRERQTQLDKNKADKQAPEKVD